MHNAFARTFEHALLGDILSSLERPRSRCTADLLCSCGVSGARMCAASFVLPAPVFGEISLISPTADKSYAQIKLLLPHDRAGCLASPPRTHQGFSFTRMYIKAISLLRSTHHSLHANLNRAFAKVCLLREHPQGRPSGRIAPQPDTTQQQHVYQAVRRAHRGRGAFYTRINGKR